MLGAVDAFEAAEHPDLCAGKLSSFVQLKGCFSPSLGDFFIPRVPGVANPRGSTLGSQKQKINTSPLTEFFLIKKI